MNVAVLLKSEKCAFEQVLMSTVLPQSSLPIPRVWLAFGAAAERTQNGKQATVSGTIMSESCTVTLTKAGLSLAILLAGRMIGESQQCSIIRLWRTLMMPTDSSDSAQPTIRSAGVAVASHLKLITWFKLVRHRVMFSPSRSPTVEVSSRSML